MRKCAKPGNTQGKPCAHARTPETPRGSRAHMREARKRASKAVGMPPQHKITPSGAMGALPRPKIAPGKRNAPAPRVCKTGNASMSAASTSQEVS